MASENPATLHSHIHKLQDNAFLGPYSLGLRQNAALYRGKSVLVVGAGVGFLAVILAQEGARVVYALEETELHAFIKQLANSNNVGNRVVSLHGKPEDVELPEKVDMVLCMPLSLLCLHECLLPSFLLARDKFLKPGGMVVPRELSVLTAPIEDAETHTYFENQAGFWRNRGFFGVNLTSQRENAVSEHFAQPMAGRITQHALLSSHGARKVFDLETVSPDTLKQFDLSIRLVSSRAGEVHGFGMWFILSLGLYSAGQEQTVTSGPHTDDAQWYTCRMLVPQKCHIDAGTNIMGRATFRANPRLNSYSAHFDVTVGEAHAIRQGCSLSDHTCSAMGSIGDAGDGYEGDAGADESWSPNMAATWFLGQADNTTQGPFTVEQIQKMISEGADVSTSTYIWREGMGNWKTMADMELFAGMFNVPRPPVPTGAAGGLAPPLDSKRPQ